MARYSEHDTSKIYEAAQNFRDNCLLRDGSLVFDDAAIWKADLPSWPPCAAKTAWVCDNFCNGSTSNLCTISESRNARIRASVLLRRA